MDRHSLSYALHEPSAPTRTPALPTSAPHPKRPDEPPASTEMTPDVVPEKRKPGRPKGSKNKKPLSGPPATVPNSPVPPVSSPGISTRSAVATPTNNAKEKEVAEAAAPVPTPVPTAIPSAHQVNAQNQQYYEFQWRMLNLCHEFYGAAEELVKSAPPLVIAQCYQMGPTSRVDPLVLLNEAKTICDTLVSRQFLSLGSPYDTTQLANPSRLITTPPPPMTTVIPTFYSPQPPDGKSLLSVIPASTATATRPSKSTSKPMSASAPATTATTSTPAGPTPPATVITNPGSFVVSLGSQPPTAAPYPYGGPYYAYPTYTGYYPVPSAAAAASTSTSPAPNSSTPMTTTGVAQGSWSENEMARLRLLSETHKKRNGEIDWDKVVTEWGNARTRHQILVKATAMGLKESSSARAAKRKREDTDPPPNPPPPNPAVAVAAAASPPSVPPSHGNTGSPAMSHASLPTPLASPAPKHLQPPTAAAGASSQSSPTMPWPMPTVAATQVSTVLTPSAHNQSLTTTTASSSGYYRGRPQSTSAAPPASTHTFVYQSGSK
ncbi:hypothetical protein HMN09_00440000 [Mycena chlorophos]|uniref:Myb-like domain-containing protein n=1 Tax=Mycena chlorophos TaxID=658473 RepID=A0A8H6WFR6_MYCCL|nr:hypothetical protein HMN09_00440000 [Mycena chlorophos]